MAAPIIAATVVPAFVSAIATGLGLTIGTYAVQGAASLIRKISQKNTRRNRQIAYEFTESAQNHLPAVIRDPYEQNEFYQKRQKRYKPQEDQDDEERNEPN